jgi:predicted XRE-type DNA-binding protein
MKQIIFVFSTLIMIACGSNFKSELEVVNQLQDKLEAAEIDFNTIDINKVATAKEAYTANIAVFKSKYISDTVDQKLAIAINEYKYLKKGSGNILGNHKLITENLQLCKEQLGNLKSDLKHNAISKEEAARFIEIERVRASETIEKIIETKASYDKLSRIYDSINPIVVRVVDSLNKI